MKEVNKIQVDAKSTESLKQLNRFGFVSLLLILKEITIDLYVCSLANLILDIYC
jgi:hypothetical protein